MLLGKNVILLWKRVMLLGKNVILLWKRVILLWKRVILLWKIVILQGKMWFYFEKMWFPVSFHGDFMIWWWFNGMFFGNNDDLIGYFIVKKCGFGGFYSNGDLMMIWWWFYLREFWQESNSIGVLVEAKSPCNWKHAGPSMMGLWWDFTIKHWFHVLSSWFISLLTNRLTIGFIVDMFSRVPNKRRTREPYLVAGWIMAVHLKLSNKKWSTCRRTSTRHQISTDLQSCSWQNPKQSSMQA